MIFIILYYYYYIRRSSSQVLNIFYISVGYTYVSCVRYSITAQAEIPRILSR